METVVPNLLQLQLPSRWNVDRVHSAIRAVARAAVAEHALALHATAQAASSRTCVDEMRALYVLPPCSGLRRRRRGSTG
jgi:uncharacterized protein YmfQ (DUF2313 family)